MRGLQNSISGIPQRNHIAPDAWLLENWSAGVLTCFCSKQPAQWQLESSQNIEILHKVSLAVLFSSEKITKELTDQTVYAQAGLLLLISR